MQQLLSLDGCKMDYIINDAPEILNEPWQSYPYEFHVGWSMYRNEEIRAWIDEVIIDWKHVRHDNAFLFKTEDAAVAFKLRWL